LPAIDPFPESWMRNQLLRAEEGVQKWFEQLRVRVRVARSLVLLTPALATSAIAWHWASTPAPQPWVTWLGSVHVPFLLLAVAAAQRLPPPDTRNRQTRPSPPEYVAWIRRSPGAIWLSLQLLASAAFSLGSLTSVAAPADGNATQQRVVSALALPLLGVMFTTLAVITWLRITKTYRQFLWDVCSTQRPADLAGAMGATGAAAPETSPVSDARPIAKA
jgi:hypothetical protein